MREPLGSSELSLDEAIARAVQVVAREFSADDNPDLQGLRTTVLKRGKIVSKVAKYWGIRSRNTGEHKYNALNLVTLRSTKKRGWEFERERSITLDDKEEDEIGKLFEFLAAMPQFAGAGEFMVISAENIEHGVGQLINVISNSDQTAELIERILSWAQSDKNATEGLVKLSTDDPTRSQALIAALNYGRYYHALNRLRVLVEENNLENVYQTFLTENYWMFGSEYAELIRNRNLVNRMEFDFPLRRTVDGYLEIIDIKRPLNGTALFRLDRRQNLTQIAELSEAITQADDYLANVDADQFRIHFHEELETEKVRAKIVVGRDGDEDQVRALRRLNARTHRIEVITFDQLIKTAERILEIMVEQNPFLKDEAEPNAPEFMSVPDIPF